MVCRVLYPASITQLPECTQMMHTSLARLPGLKLLALYSKQTPSKIWKLMWLQKAGRVGVVNGDRPDLAPRDNGDVDIGRSKSLPCRPSEPSQIVHPEYLRPRCLS